MEVFSWGWLCSARQHFDALCSLQEIALNDPLTLDAGTTYVAQCIIDWCPPTSCKWTDACQWLSTTACTRGVSAAKEGYLP